MADVGTEAPVRIRFVVKEDDALAGEIESGLREKGGSDVSVERREPDDRFPFVVVAIAGLIAVAGVAQVMEFIRGKRNCRTMIDARGDEIETTYECEIKDGRIIVIAKDKTKVEIIDVPDVFDATEVIKAAASATGQAVKDAAEKIGGTVRGPEPAKSNS